MDKLTNAQYEAAKNIAIKCANLASDETTLIICEGRTRNIAELFKLQIQNHGNIAEIRIIEELVRHGQEPPKEVADMMLKADVIYGVTWKSLAHTKARSEAAEAGARFLSLPEFSLELLKDPSLLVDFREFEKISNNLANLLSNGSTIRIISESGTNIKSDIFGRIGNSCPGCVSFPGDLGSPPDIEANISPIENSSNGSIVVDGSIPFSGMGLLSTPIELVVEHGFIKKINGKAEMVERLEELFDRFEPKKSRILAEFGFGLNPKATLTGNMLTDEGTLGTVHFGFGSNITVGGLNDVSFHLDFVCRSYELQVDGIPVAQDGVML